MVRTIFALLTALSSIPAAAAGRPLQPTPAAVEIFERDWVLMNWALKYYDSDGDILLQPNEAEAAAEAFRKLADVNHDGRITPEEYRAAREMILAKY